MAKRGRTRAGILCSGGLDSTVLMGDLLDKGIDLHPICFDDGSPTYHAKERPVIYAVCTHYGIMDRLIETRIYDNDRIRSNDEYGFIPGFKMIMQVTAMSHLAFLKINTLYMAYIADNYRHTPYKDEMTENIDATTRLFNRIYDSKIKVKYPYHALEKSDLVTIADRLKVPLELTTSCDSVVHTGVTHCGRCQWCQNRQEAFRLAGVADPTFYALPNREITG